jgi:integrase
MSALARLTDIQIRQAKPRPKPYKLPDGGGLHLLIKPDGGRYWRYKYRHLGKERTMALGVYPEVSAAKAREGHRAARQLLASGVDPMAERKKTKLEAALSAETTFEGVAREFWAAQLEAGRSSDYVDLVLAQLEKHVFPWVGQRPIAEVDELEMLAILKRAAGASPEVVRKLRSSTGQVFRYAMATRKAQRDPVATLRGAFVTPKGGHFAAITKPSEFGELLRAIHAYRGDLVTRCLLKLSPILFQRPNELREGPWDEFDLDGKEWGVPMWEISAHRADAGGDTKITRTGWEAHLVPLPTQAVEILRELKPLTGHTGLVFHSARNPGSALSEGALLAALRRMGYAGRMTAHGFRASARTMGAERLKIDSDLLELQISHKVVDSHGRAYNRTQLLEERIQAMQAWADYLDRLRAGGSVVPFKREAA